jgi:uncharacterized membrane protein YtjA (UPF0391 family)
MHIDFMKYFSLVLLFAALVCALLGFGGLPSVAGSITRTLFVVFFLLFAVALDTRAADAE